MWFAVTRTAPDGVQAVGDDPIRAMTASPLLKRSATTGVIALPPSVPPSASVVQQRRLVALTVTLLPPIIVTPSWISARVSELGRASCREGECSLGVAAGLYSEVRG